MTIAINEQIGHELSIYQKCDIPLKLRIIYYLFDRLIFLNQSHYMHSVNYIL